MAIAVDPNKPFDYVLSEDRGAPDPTVWELKPLTVTEEAEVRDSLAAMGGAGEGVRILTGSHELKVLRLGLVGVRNFYDAAGNPVEFAAAPDRKNHPTRMVPTDAFLSRIAPVYRVELANAITDGSRVTEAERKN